ncbi:hypothetical protein PsorP6_008391 [Peronosclerospora sorghi]|uniref:Uncharacterized protein n=1 Tax=Peronosclerospora sorghi TaxID=230839 RepID=A0ACC0W8W8_9STRA|nr:hypothetical protein PsorP6_008391 [Peronosclerospora sorghi]
MHRSIAGGSGELFTPVSSVKILEKQRLRQQGQLHAHEEQTDASIGEQRKVTDQVNKENMFSSDKESEKCVVQPDTIHCRSALSSLNLAK